MDSSVQRCLRSPPMAFRRNSKSGERAMARRDSSSRLRFLRHQLRVLGGVTHTGNTPEQTCYATHRRLTKVRNSGHGPELNDEAKIASFDASESTRVLGWEILTATNAS